jgi:endonuclease/exonuclease/phosphatase family metal-dependent hydrolase
MGTRRTATVLILLLLVVSVTFVVFYMNIPNNDVTSPEITIISPEEGEVVSGVVFVNFTVSDQSPISKREILIDGAVRANTQVFSWNTTLEVNGAHNVTCRAQDSYSNWGEAMIMVEVSNQVSQNNPPTVTIVNPTDNSYVSGSVLIQVSVVDEETLTPDLYINDQHMTKSTSLNWETTSVANGEYSILANVTDSGGLSDSDVIHVTVFNSHVTLNFTGEFKVMSYNIEAGGANADWKEVVKEENPDIMILVETGTWDDSNNYLLNQAVNEFNAYFSQEAPYEGYTAQGIGYSTSGEAILSRFPILNFIQIPVVPLDNGTAYDVTHDFIHAVVSINGTSVNIIGAHLKASGGVTNEHRREWETEGIINYMDNLGGVPIMYMGDLNSFSPADTGNLAPSGDLGYGPLTMMLYPNDPTYGQFSSDVHNFTDVFRTLNPTYPGYSYGHQNPIYTSRIDYILVNSFFAGRLINSTCGDTAHADTGSDHYSVDVFIGWNSTGTQDMDPPAQVTGLNATVVSYSKINLAWNANSEPDLFRYIVYRNDTVVAQVATTYYNDTGLSANTTYRYEVSAKDISGNEGPKSEGVKATTLEALAADLIVLNEFLPDPYTLYAEEWIELYNPSGVDVNLEGYILDDLIGGGTNPYTMPAGTVIPAGGFLLFNQSTTNIALNNAGDDVNLIKPDGTTVQDTFTYESSSNDVSYGRVTDGGPTWTTFTTPTPGASNSGSGSMMLNHRILTEDFIHCIDQPVRILFGKNEWRLD